jgi:hypothetical protein
MLRGLVVVALALFSCGCQNEAVTACSDSNLFWQPCSAQDPCPDLQECVTWPEGFSVCELRCDTSGSCGGPGRGLCECSVFDFPDAGLQKFCRCAFACGPVP